MSCGGSGSCGDACGGGGGGSGRLMPGTVTKQLYSKRDTIASSLRRVNKYPCQAIRYLQTAVLGTSRVIVLGHDQDDRTRTA